MVATPDAGTDELRVLISLSYQTWLPIANYFKATRGPGPVTLAELAEMTETQILEIENVGPVGLARIILLLVKNDLRLTGDPEVPFDHLVEHLVVRDGVFSFRQYRVSRDGYAAIKQAGYHDIRDLAQLNRVQIAKLVSRGGIGSVIRALDVRGLSLPPLARSHTVRELRLPRSLANLLREAKLMDAPIGQLSQNGLYSQIVGRGSQLDSPAIWAHIRALTKVLLDDYGYELPEHPRVR